MQNNMATHKKRPK